MERSTIHCAWPGEENLKERIHRVIQNGNEAELEANFSSLACLGRNRRTDSRDCHVPSFQNPSKKIEKNLPEAVSASCCIFYPLFPPTMLSISHSCAKKIVGGQRLFWTVSILPGPCETMRDMMEQVCPCPCCCDKPS